MWGTCPLSADNYWDDIRGVDDRGMQCGMHMNEDIRGRDAGWTWRVVARAQGLFIRKVS
jgi:hypothetical protein